jgi:hypothetical protein
MVMIFVAGGVCWIFIDATKKLEPETVFEPVLVTGTWRRIIGLLQRFIKKVSAPVGANYGC